MPDLRSMESAQQTDVSLISIGRTNGTVNGTFIDTGREHFSRAVKFNFAVWTDGVGKWTIEDSKDGTAVNSILDADHLHDPDGALDSVDLNSVNVIDATKDDTVVTIGLLSAERFVRAVNVVSGSTSGAIGGADIVSGAKRFAGAGGQPFSDARAPSPIRNSPVI